MGMQTPSKGLPTNRAETNLKALLCQDKLHLTRLQTPGCASTLSAPHFQDPWAGLGWKDAAVPH